jgi:hypothetical protein
MTFYILIRLLDLYSTYLNMNLTNSWEDIEFAPASRYLIGNLGFEVFALFNILLSLFIYWVFYKLKRVYIINYFTIFNFVIVLMNLYVYFKTLQILHKI